MKTSASRAAVAVCAAAIAAGVLSTRAGAHKPITSPYTFADDVAPILRERCSRCHVSQGVAPMSLLTHAETVPWGESMRLELIAGHMPPWPAQTTAGRFRYAPGLTARELNVLLTWASGGTPPGDTATAAPPSTLDSTWRLGAPDLVIPLPGFALGADVQERTAEFVIPAGTTSTRWLRAADLLPGTPAIVRSATVSVQRTTGTVGAAAPDLLLWQPGDEPFAMDGAALRLPAGSRLIVSVRYKKTWEYERAALTDQSTVGLYFATGPPAELQTFDVASPGRVLDRAVRVLAITPDSLLTNTNVRLEAVRPDGSRDMLIAFRPQAQWRRRYWFDQPVTLPAGTRLTLGASTTEPAPRLTLDVTTP